jgi:hypothetical protein
MLAALFIPPKRSNFPFNRTEPSNNMKIKLIALTSLLLFPGLPSSLAESPEVFNSTMVTVDPDPNWMEATNRSHLRGRSKMERNYACVSEDLVTCGKNKVFICHYDEVEDQYKTICVRKNGAFNGHIKSHERDYCGECSLSRQFIHESIISSIEPEEGTELVSATNGDVFKVSYDLKFNDAAGFISLAASEQLLGNVSCTRVANNTGSIQLSFIDEVQEDLLTRLFPASSLLVVDSTLFGDCSFNGDQDTVFAPDDRDGFLFVKSATITNEIAFRIVDPLFGPSIQLQVEMEDMMSADGTSIDGIKISIKQEEINGQTGDIRGLFFHVRGDTASIHEDDIVMVTGTDPGTNYRGKVEIGKGVVERVGRTDVQIKEKKKTGRKYDVGIEIGTKGILIDDITETTVTIMGLTVRDIEGEMAVLVRRIGDKNKKRKKRGFRKYNSAMIVDVPILPNRRVTLVGEVATFNHVFSHKKMIYTLVNNRRDLRAIGSEVIDTVGITFPPGDDSLSLKVESELKLSGGAYIDMIRDTFDINVLSESTVDFAIEFGFQLGADLTAALVLSTSSSLDLYDKVWEHLCPKYPIYGVKMPDTLLKVLSILLPKSLELKLMAGIFATAPPALKASYTSELEIRVEAVAKASTGSKTAQLSIEGPLSNLQTSWDFSKSEPASFESNVTKPEWESLLPSSSISLEGFAGVRPSVLVECFGLADAYLSIDTGLFATAEITNPPSESSEDKPGLPYEINCDECHKAELSLEFGLKNPSFGYRYYGMSDDDEDSDDSIDDSSDDVSDDDSDEPGLIELDWLDLEFVVPLLKVCLLPVLTCDSDCNTTDAGTECCADSDCGLAQVCNSKICETQQACVPGTNGVICCNDLDCGGSADFYCENYRCVESTCEVGGHINCCNLTDCEKGKTCTSNQCIALGNPRFTLEWFGDGKFFCR